MDENTPEETGYIFTDTATDGTPLNGTSLYAITFPAEVPAEVRRAFWAWPHLP
jgi:hypothetical protein